MMGDADADRSIDRLLRPAAAGMTPLATAECWVLLEAGTVARLAMVTAAGEPELYPVNYTVFERMLLIRTADDNKLRHLRAHALIAMEIDGQDADTNWSVVVRGPATPVELDAERRRMRSALPPARGPHAKPFVVKVEPTSITGRRFQRPGDDSAAPTDGSNSAMPPGAERPAPIASHPPPARE